MTTENSGSRNGASVGCEYCADSPASMPVALDNRPGLTAIAYRSGTHAQFKSRMLAALSAYGSPALSALTARTDDDLSVALIDAWATALDVLTFYQERIANECLLRTATERRSVLELARLLGYELRPGVAASTLLAFTLDALPGAPQVAPVPVGTKVQSLPLPGQNAQIFETVEAIEARAAWSAIKPQQRCPRIPAPGDTSVRLEGTSNNLKVGDVLLFVGDERRADPSSDRWLVRPISDVATDSASGTTTVRLVEPLDDKLPANSEVQVFRVRASLFGSTAPDFLAVTGQYQTKPPTLTPSDWPTLLISGIDSLSSVHLDGAFGAIVPRSWIFFRSLKRRLLYQVEAVAESHRTGFALSGRTTMVTLSASLPPQIDNEVRTMVVLAAPEPLRLADSPGPLPNVRIPLETPVTDLPVGRTIIVTGRAPRVTVSPYLDGDLAFFPEGATTYTVARRGDVFDLLQIQAPDRGGDTRYDLRNAAGVTGAIAVLSRDAERSLLYTPADPTSPLLTDVTQVASVEDDANGSGSILVLATPLTRLYDRASVAILGNVVQATHGETVQETLGSGNAAETHATFTLKQTPLTYVPAATASGATSTLRLYANDMAWREVASLYGTSPQQRVFAVRHGDDGKATLQFGDGVSEGARLPTGQANVRAVYRRGIGESGNLQPGQLSLLMTRSAGLAGVTNPVEARGGLDPEPFDQAQNNCPNTVLTIDRVVSLADYEAFARSFAGIAKVHASWTRDGVVPRVVLTVAGPAGARITPTDAAYQNLEAAIHGAGDPNRLVAIKSYRPATFRLSARIRRDPAGASDAVALLATADSALRAAFSFEARNFGQPVVLSQIMATLQAVPGVLAVTVDAFYRAGASPSREEIITASIPSGQQGGGPLAAELLTLAPGPLDALVEMQ